MLEGAEIGYITHVNTMQPSYFVGLDLAQSQDYSALVILERRGHSPQTYRFDCKYLKRWELRTSYPQIVSDVVKLVNSPQLTENVRERPVLAIDQTGVGAGVADMFRLEKMTAKLIPIYITSGSDVTRSGDVRRVPKRTLVTNTAIALQTGKLQISEQLPLTETLIAELQNFKAKITTAGNDTFGAGASPEWRVGAHDDLVLALAMALFCANDGVKTGTFWSFE
jgi:hypothetical protein